MPSVTESTTETSAKNVDLLAAQPDIKAADGIWNVYVGNAHRQFRLKENMFHSNMYIT